MEQNRNLDRVMEARDHFKNGASLKSLMSKGIYLVHILVILSFLAGVVGCKARQPRLRQIESFVEGDGGWVSVVINRNLQYELAFDDVLSIITRNFEIDMISAETGYVRTKWNTTYIRMSNGAIYTDYRVRVTIRMSKERMRVDINAEAERLRRGYWIKGYDTRLLETMRRDIAGVVGM